MRGWTRLHKNSWTLICEVTSLLANPREIMVFNLHKITWDVNTKQLEMLTEIKRYKRIFDKDVVDRRNFFSFPYGYLRPDEEGEEMEWELNTPWN